MLGEVARPDAGRTRSSFPPARVVNGDTTTCLFRWSDVAESLERITMQRTDDRHDRRGR